LIGKYLDGEITPSEQQILEAALDGDVHSKRLLEQCQDLHQRSREVVASEILGRGKSAQEIFESACGTQHRAKHPLRSPMDSLQRTIKVVRRLRFAAGLAAGLVIGLALHFTLLARLTPQRNQALSNEIVKNTDNRTDAQGPALRPLPLDSTRNVTRNVDWYSFTDENGDQWLIEGLRENTVRPASYSPDL
jgi:hypothetical protein